MRVVSTASWVISVFLHAHATTTTDVHRGGSWSWSDDNGHAVVGLQLESFWEFLVFAAVFRAEVLLLQFQVWIDIDNMKGSTLSGK